MSAADLAPGDRIELLAMPEDPDGLPVGATGTVTRATYHDVFKSWQVFVKWDAPHQARTLMLVMPPDRIHKLQYREEPTP